MWGEILATAWEGQSPMSEMHQTSTERHVVRQPATVRDWLRLAAPFAAEARKLPPVSDKTRGCYEKACARLMRGIPVGTVPCLPATNKNSWSLYRTALARCSREALLGALEAALHKKEGVDIPAIVAAWASIAAAFPFAPPVEARQAREGERRNDAALAALAAAILTGCRPAELETGVVVEAQPVAGLLSFAIHGAKVTAAHGQPWRVIRVPLRSAPADYLGELAEASGEWRVTVRYGAGEFSKVVAGIAGLRWGRRISGYDIRHARAADATEELDADGRARLLGHVSRETGAYYGRGKKGRRLALMGGEFAAVHAPRPVHGRDYSKRAAPAAATDALEAAEESPTAEPPSLHGWL